MKTLSAEEKLQLAEQEIERLSSALHETNRELSVLRPKYNDILNKHTELKKQFDTVKQKADASEDRYQSVVEDYTFIILGLLRTNPGVLHDVPDIMENIGSFSDLREFVTRLIIIKNDESEAT